MHDTDSSADLYHFVHDCYVAITNTTVPAAVLSVLSDQINNPYEASINRTNINITVFLRNLMTNYTTDSAVTQRFTSIATEVLGEQVTVDATTIDIMGLQKSVGHALSKTLNAILANWNTSYFDTLSRDGALLSNQPKNAFQSNKSPALVPPKDFLENLQLNPLSNISSSRALLSSDVTQNQNFFIHECDAGSPGGLAEQLSSLLDSFHINLFQVMKETTKGSRSHLGFSQLFKTYRWIPIRRLYEHMFRAVGTRGNSAANQAIPDNRPVFICLQPHNEATRAVYAACAAEPRLRAFQQPGAPYAIGLCPAFWALPRAPVRAFCPYKGRVNEEYTGNALQLNQQSIIVHQLVRIYLGAGVLVPELYALKDVLKLNAEDSYWNPSTWSYWFACEYWSSFSFPSITIEVERRIGD